MKVSEIDHEQTGSLHEVIKPPWTVSKLNPNRFPKQVDDSGSTTSVTSEYIHNDAKRLVLSEMLVFDRTVHHT